MERPPGTVAAVATAAGGPTDLELVERIRQGDQAALDLLYKRYSAPVYSLVWKVLQSSEEAEDVALDVFWQVWRQAGRYDPSRGAPPAWIFTLARSRAIDRLRARKRREGRTVSIDDPDLNIDPLDEKAAPDEVVSFRQNRDAVRAAMAKLSATQREAVELAFLEGMTHVEIAERLGQPLGTVKTRIRQGLIRLRKHLD
ncbi:MAG TPA: sigma-70 family RNA polymerase sigma factor [Thermoanaerobaculia bacterium]|jgi:RNA polymerase sigma-70 factor (ECF subfamily)|nr:sigma-70 family RNA polymerase sigma factor [Thermoanaerobaculia bacterium]HPA51373.1 sigma-70 family RNA polymerase sigma factor [Thermoanaerobaculia bacterium]HQN07627.1 sigma-70 family RNA polymerase sigma factor [Thermoanaerobaculia bacterium]HQP84653.1 sigma-70 family RNA polymerase sigma factor [Thermoanaerobaculia bacterium]